MRRRERSRGLTSLVRAACAVPRAPSWRSIFVAVASLLRSRRHACHSGHLRGLGVAVCLISIVAAEVRAHCRSPSRAYLLAIPLVMIFFVVFGLRSACAVPTELEPTGRSAVRARRLVSRCRGRAPCWRSASCRSRPDTGGGSSGRLVADNDGDSHPLRHRLRRVPDPMRARAVEQGPVRVRACPRLSRRSVAVGCSSLSCCNLFAFRLADFQVPALQSIDGALLYVAVIGAQPCLYGASAGAPARRAMDFDDDRRTASKRSAVGGAAVSQGWPTLSEYQDK